MKNVLTVTAFLGLSACGGGSYQIVDLGDDGTGRAGPDLVASDELSSETLGPSKLGATRVRPAIQSPTAAGARSVEQFDTTTSQERAEAVAPPSGGERSLGTTIASLGSPTDPGIWFKTSLVSQVTQGRVEYNGTSVNLELRPSGGAAGAGSQISLAAMRLIGAPLTGLPEVSVYAN